VRVAVAAHISVGRMDAHEFVPLIPRHLGREEPAHPPSAAVRKAHTWSPDGALQNERSTRKWACLGLIGVAMGLVSAAALYGYGTGRLKARMAAQPPGDLVVTANEGAPNAVREGVGSLSNILIVYIDDQGYNDMGPHSTDLSELTPNIMELASDGVWLSQYYGQHVCTASRAALLTGRYPINSGMSHSMISGNDPWGLPLEYNIMPQFVKKLGSYTTHMVGKWHLGHFAQPQTPLARGFDTFYGFYSGFQGYFYHTAEISYCASQGNCYYDLWDNGEPVTTSGGVYNLYLFTERAVDVIASHADASSPFLLYFAAANPHLPVEAPVSEMARYAAQLEAIPNTQRRTYACMTMMLDESVGNLTRALKEYGVFNDTIIVVASDNGASPRIMGSGSNYPLRGEKNLLWEGGYRVPALVRSELIPAVQRGTTYGGMWHVTDWIPTLAGMLNQTEALAVELSAMDGVNQWPALVDRTVPSPRQSLLYNIDFFDGVTSGALRVGDMKILCNVQYAPVYPVPQGNNLTYEMKIDGGKYTNQEYLDYLFNVTADPTESIDLKGSLPDVFATMKQELARYEAEMAAPAYCGATDTAAAQKVFNATQFVGPWITDPSWKCPMPNDIDDAAQNARQVEILCLYGLLSEERCLLAV